MLVLKGQKKNMLHLLLVSYGGELPMKQIVLEIYVSIGGGAGATFKITLSYQEISTFFK